MQINETAYQRALQMNKGKTFSTEGGADECFRYFISCYEAAKPSGQPVDLALAKAAEILANFKSNEPTSNATDVQRLERKLEEWQACYAMLFKQFNDAAQEIRKLQRDREPVSLDDCANLLHERASRENWLWGMDNSREYAKTVLNAAWVKYV